MFNDKSLMDRRTILKLSLAACALGASNFSLAANQSVGMKAIPSSGEKIPMVGLGTWIVFNVGDDPVLKDECADVVEAFIKHGGKMIDSSPMYGSAHQTIGYALDKLNAHTKVFSADKVWTPDRNDGKSQIEETRSLWGVENFDLLQVHNLVAWQAHLETLFEMKMAGKLRYVGITTSHGRRHADLAKIIETQPIDFLQLTYNIEDREAEERLLPLAREKGIAVIANRPYQRGGLFSRTNGKPLPQWALEETGAESWAQFLLKFVISHPAVTCAIPATSKVEHVIENMKSSQGIMPDEKIRAKMSSYMKDL